MPGASKLITCRPSAASARSKGTPRSRLAPSPVIRSSGGPDPRTETRSLTWSASTSTKRIVRSSGEGARTRDVPADDERLDGLGARVGVDRLDAVPVPHPGEVEEDPVAAKQIPGLEDDLPCLGGVVHLRDRRDRVGQVALLDQPAEPQAVQLHGADLGEHLDQLVLHDLEARQWLAKLLPLLAIGPR